MTTKLAADAMNNTHNHRPLSVLRNRHIWYLTLLILAASILAFHDFLLHAVGLPHTGWGAIFEAHSLHWILFLLPLLYGTYVFGVRGAVIIIPIVTSLFISHTVFLLPAGLEHLFADMAFFVLVCIMGILMAVSRNQREQVRKAYIAAVESEELFKTMSNSSPVGIYIVQDGKFQLVNPQFQKLTGYSEDELLGMDPLRLVLAEDRSIVRENAVKMLKGHRSSPYEYRVVNKAGETRWVIETVTSIYYQGRRAALGNYMDITERKRAEEREKRLQQELNLASRLASIGEMAAGIAHEINNPLTTVIGFSQLLMRSDVTDDIRDDLQVIDSEAQRVAKIVAGLLTFARKRQPDGECVDTNAIISRALELRSYEMEVNNIQVITRLAPDLPQTMADASQLQQVFLNIILNAEKAMIEAHNKGKLLIKTEKIDGSIRVSFADDGPGISPENLDRVFDPFFTTREVGEGTGLGLSICHGIIAAHKGRIYAESESGKGATFVVELPIATHTAHTGKAEVIKGEAQKPGGAKILVIDDEIEQIRKDIDHILTKDTVRQES